MGIDVYLKWKGMSQGEIEAQWTGFNIHRGHVGYLREAYHGGTYATRILLKEAFENETATMTVPTSVLKERLPETVKAAIQRSAQVYGEEITEEDPTVKAYTDFVAMHERLENEGKMPYIVVSY